VLLNLISNGFYAATKRKAEANGGDYEPTLAAKTKNLGDSVEIIIRDNCTGIPLRSRKRCSIRSLRPSLPALILLPRRSACPRLGNLGEQRWPRLAVNDLTSATEAPRSAPHIPTAQELLTFIKSRSIGGRSSSSLRAPLPILPELTEGKLTSTHQRGRVKFLQRGRIRNATAARRGAGVRLQ
jgi:hypothetical protein